MKKEKILKYLILICSMVMSFFMFTNREVRAIDYSVNNGKIILEIEPVNSEDVSEGYLIVGATTSCALGDEECTDWHIPEDYLGNPIVGIVDGASGVAGVLENLSDVISGTVYVGNEMKTLGKCAFCNFSNVVGYVLGENVTTIGEYAFINNEALEIIEIKAYNNGIRTELTNINAFDDLEYSNLSKIVFKNTTIAREYQTSVNGWDEVDVLFTFKVTYLFYDHNNTLYETKIAYVDDVLGELPEINNSINKVGFDYKWISKTYSNEITANSLAIEAINDVTLGPIHEVMLVWSLKKATINIGTEFNGVTTEHADINKSVVVDYIGKNRVMEITSLVYHELLTANDPKFSIEYSWSKVISGITSDDISNESKIGVSRVLDSGVYKCNVILNYEGYTSVVQNVEILVTIRPKNLIININDLENEFGNYLDSNEDTTGLYYEVDESTPLLDGERIELFDFNGYYEKKKIGIYTNVLTGEVKRIGYESDPSTNYVSDYNISYVKGNLTIVAKKLDMDLSDDIELEYGSVENLTKNIVLSIYGEQKQITIDYVREDVANKNVGSYDVIDARVVNGNVVDENYEVVLPAVNEGKIVIKPKKVTVLWNIDENLVYSGIEKSVSASYKDISNETINLTVGVLKNEVASKLVNAGTYNVTASMSTINTNYELVNYEKVIEIEKANSVFIGEQRQVVTYNGLPQKVNVSLNHSEGTIVYGNYSNCKNAHLSSSSTCTITVSVEATENYKAISGNFYLHINPYELIVEPVLFEFNYGTIIGQYNLNSTYDGVNGEKVVVYFAKEGSTSNLNVGYYNIASTYLSDNTNYKATMVKNSGANKIKINPAPVEVRFYFYEDLVYDGTVKNIGIRYFGTEEDVGLVVDYGDKSIIKNAGDYRIDVSLTNDNFFIDGRDYLEFSIAKANYDISNLKLDSQEVRFNFKSHFINLEGELPEGLIAIYTIDGNYGNGTYLPFKHTVTVSFEGDFENYNRVEPLVATLNINMSWVFITLALVIFVGVGVPLTFILLIKYNVIRFRRRIKRSVIRSMIRKNRELDKLNNLLRERKSEQKKLDEEKDPEIIVEEPVKFVKKPVNLAPEELISMAFVDELFKSNYATKQFYSEVKNELLSYEGIVSKIKRDFETFYLNNIPVAKVDVVDGILYVYFALDPSQYKVEEYKHENVSKEKDFTSVPLKLRVDSISSLRHAKMFVRIIRKREGIKSVSNFIRTDYVSVYSAKESSLSLFKKVFVKKGTKEYFED